MSRKILRSARELFDAWFKENVSPKIPTADEVAELKTKMIEAQGRYEQASHLRSVYQMTLRYLGDRMPSETVESRKTPAPTPDPSRGEIIRKSESPPSRE